MTKPVQPTGGDPNTLSVSFVLNGTAITLEAAPTDRLLDTLRYTLGLPGTKEGCGEGECGACTVYLDGLPSNACLIPSFQVRGRRVDTVESLDPATLDNLHRHGATQCGACTPGVAMTARWLAEQPELLSDHAGHTVRELMAGNLCRCTGYDGIIDGITADLATPPAGDDAV